MTIKGVPVVEIIKALWQWTVMAFAILFFLLLGFFVVPFTIWRSRPMINFVGENHEKHAQKYIDAGSSGEWEYIGCDTPFLQWFSNLEDGNLGEPNGKHSARCGGNERSFKNQYYWLAKRNPANYLKRTWDFFHCLIDECAIEYWGDETVSDKGGAFGWHFVKATHRHTGKAYYCWRYTKDLGDNECRYLMAGFKIKPTHANEIQDADDKDKAFTIRLQYRSEMD